MTLVTTYVWTNVGGFTVYLNHGSYGQEKSGKTQRVRESQGKSKYQGAKVKRCRKNFELFYADCVQQFTNFFLLVSLADYLYLFPKICSTTFVSSAIASD